MNEIRKLMGRVDLMGKETDKKKIKFKLDWPIPLRNKQLIHEVEVPVVENANEREQTEGWEYLRGIEPFIDPKGWWKIEKIRGKHLLGLRVNVGGKTHYHWIGSVALHKLLLGIIYVSIKNDQFPGLTAPRSKQLEKDLSAFKSLIGNMHKELIRVWGVKFLDEFMKGVEDGT